MGCTGWSIRDLGREAGHEKENTLAAGISLLFLILVTVLELSGRMPHSRSILQRKNLPPGTGGLFGTDWMGRDMLKRTVAGLSLSIRLGLLTAAISAAVALALALLASLGGGLMDSLVCGLVNLVMGIPHMLLLILISTVWERDSGGGSGDCPDALGVAGEAFAGRKSYRSGKVRMCGSPKNWGKSPGGLPGTTSSRRYRGNL